MDKQDKLQWVVGKTPVPSTRRRLAQMNLIKSIESKGHTVDITLYSTGLTEESQEWIKNNIKDSVTMLDSDLKVNTIFIEGSTSDINVFGKIIAVMSGKGGVGKSLVSGLTAVTLKRAGFEVGILDADITGPSIPKMFGIKTRPSFNSKAMLPVPTETGIEVMSLNLLLGEEDEAVIWRGPIIGKVITQFWEQVIWGKLDYLIIDLPPGTADAPLTILGMVPVSGIIIVTTPQDLTTMIVKKAVKMAASMNKPILGIVENMSYLYVPEIDKKIELFGKSRVESIAKAAGAPVIASLPIDPDLVALIDKGQIEKYENETAAQMGQKIAELASNLKPARE